MAESETSGVCVSCGDEVNHRTWKGLCFDCSDRQQLAHDPLALKIYERISMGGNTVVMAQFIAELARKHQVTE